jgi:hypothetical protein
MNYYFMANLGQHEASRESSQERPSHVRRKVSWVSAESQAKVRFTIQVRPVILNGTRLPPDDL